MTIATIGHSTHPYETFLQLLESAGITAVADVRSVPFSRYTPQYNQDALKRHLQSDGIAYSFLGKELGGRPRDDRLYSEGVADYERLMQTEDVQAGLARLAAGARKFNIALMCSEQDPLDCHRCLMLGRALHAESVIVNHLFADGAVQDHGAIEMRLLRIAGRECEDMFLSRKARIATAYRERARKIGFASEPELAS